MNELREIVFYENYFYDFFNKQSEKGKEKMKLWQRKKII
jgi:hypothetical protein